MIDFDSDAAHLRAEAKLLGMTASLGGRRAARRRQLLPDNHPDQPELAAAVERYDRILSELRSINYLANVLELRERMAGRAS